MAENIENPYPPEYFARQDERDDALFYTEPRKVVHIDEPAIQTLTNAYNDLLPADATILDLMSSWRSHLPLEQILPRLVVGLGMNREEMADNFQLDEFIVHDLNAEPRLPFTDGSFEVVVCAVSVQYLVQPLAVFQEVWRVLAPGGLFVVSFSNRCFPTKTTAVWLNTDDAQHVQLVASYFNLTGPWQNLNARIKSFETGAPAEEEPLFIVWANKQIDE